MRFQGAGNLVRIGDDGRPVGLTDSYEKQYLETAPPSSAVHGNPGFEDETAGVPDVWDFTWHSATATNTSETTVVYSGERSLKVHLDAGGGDQVVLSDTFDVASGGLVNFSTFAVKDTGSPKIRLGLLTGASGTPVFLAPATYTNNENALAPVGTDWGMFQRTAIVPAGHTKARLFYRLQPATTEACTVYLDLTASAPTYGAEYDSGWIGLPFASNWSDAGFGWSNCQYRRKGDDLYLRGLATRTSSASGADAVIATLPDGFRPSSIRLVADSYLTSASLPTASMLTINTSGEIVTKASVPSGAYVALERVLPL